MEPLDHVSHFLPAILDGRICSANDRKLLSLPVKFGGLSIPIFSEIAEREFINSKLTSQQLILNIKNQVREYIFDNKSHNTIKRDIVKSRDQLNTQKLENIRSLLKKDEIRANDLAAQMKGSSSWLTSLPLKTENYILNKREFFDAVAIRYRWQLKRLPILCACGKKFTTDHAMSCLKGGFIHQRHDIIRDTLSKIFEEVCTDVPLLPITGEDLARNVNKADESRLDIAARGFWQRGEKAFFDVRVFNPFAASYSHQKLQNVFQANEREKKRSYNKRVIEIEHGSFTPLVFTPYGGYGREGERCISHLAEKISIKKDISLSVVTNWLRMKLAFTTIRSAVLCVRGSRTLRNKMCIDGADIEITDFNGKIQQR